MKCIYCKGEGMETKFEHGHGTSAQWYECKVCGASYAEVWPSKRDCDNLQTREGVRKDMRRYAEESLELIKGEK